MVHEGTTDSRDYYVYIRNDKLWFKCDDTKVSEISDKKEIICPNYYYQCKEQEHSSIKNAYLLIYELKYFKNRKHYKKIFNSLMENFTFNKKFDKNLLFFIPDENNFKQNDSKLNEKHKKDEFYDYNYQESNNFSQNKKFNPGKPMNNEEFDNPFNEPKLNFSELVDLYNDAYENDKTMLETVIKNLIKIESL